MMDCTTAFAVPGSSSIIDCIHPVTGRSWINGESLEQIRLRYPGAEIVNIADFCAAKAQRQDSPIQWSEVTADDYEEMLCVLPPAAMMGGGFLVGEPCDHHATSGQPRYRAYIKRAGQYLVASRPMTVKEFKSVYAPISAHAANEVAS